MIERVIITNPKDEELVLNLRNPDESGLIIQNIEGLGPTDADIITTDVANADGSIFSSSRAQDRNIVFTLAMLFAPDIETARQKTYRYFPVKKQIKIRVETDHRVAETTGYVERNEPDIFSKEETAKISVICPDPYFHDLGYEETVFSGTQPMFEFPFSNESLTEPLIEFGKIRLDTRAILVYNGDADIGINITIHATDQAGDITIYNTETREKMHIDTNKLYTLTGVRFGTGDDIQISTIKGNKYARLLHAGTTTNILSCLDKDADWFQLSQGDNVFMFTAGEGETDLVVTFAYRNAYGGI